MSPGVQYDLEQSWSDDDMDSDVTSQPDSEDWTSPAGHTPSTPSSTSSSSGSTGKRSGKTDTVSRRMTSQESVSSRRERMLMRPWLQQQADQRSIANMTWYNDEHTMLRIPWKHGSRSGWTLDDCQLYRAWAKHTGKYSASHEEPKRWKANFRCALNSLPDVREIKYLGQTRGKDPFKVYSFLAETARRPSHKKLKRCRRSGVEHSSKMSSNNIASRHTANNSSSCRRRKVSGPGGLSTASPLAVTCSPVVSCRDIVWPTVDQCDDTNFAPFFTELSPIDTEFTTLTHTCGGVIPTVVEELSNESDDADMFDLNAELETLTAVSELTVSCDDLSSSFNSMSPGSTCSSGYLSESQYIDEALNDIESVIPSWCKTDVYLIPTSISTSDDFVVIKPAQRKYS